jgi:cytochrome c-type biogenesis protein CcmH/NrfG
MNWDLMALPLGVMAIAVVLAVVFIRGLSDERDTEAQSRGERVKTLLEEKKELLARLRELEEGEDREDLLVSGRALLAEIEALDGEEAGTGVLLKPTRVFGGLHSRLAIFVVLVAVLFVGLSIYLVQRESQVRMDDQETTARLAHMEVERYKARLVDEPEDVEALKFLTRRAIFDGDMGTAMTMLRRGEELVSEDTDFAVYASALAIMVGMPERAFNRLDPILEAEPTHVEALWWKGVAFASMGRYDEAKVSLEAVLAHGSGTEEAGLSKGLLAEIELMSNVEVHASGSVTLVDNTEVPKGGVLYVAALRAPVSGGPPLAAARFPRFDFPKDFALTAANMPMGGDWPDEFWMRVRIDADGDPMTKSDLDVTTDILGPFERGAEGISIQLGN